MQEQNTINQIEPTNDILDYSFLRQVGIEEIQKLAGNVWTDYNYHDPGITIMEILAFALTELGYKSRYSVKDILATKGSKINDTLYSPSEALSSHPVTTTDFHKIILDVDGIKDVIFYPSKKYPEYIGIYDINIELFPEYDNKKYREEVKNIVFEKAYLRRNLCEDFYEVNFIEHEPVVFEIDVSVNDKQDLEDIYLQIYEELFEYISPTAKFKSLQDLIDMGYTVDEIYDGPFLKSGFLTEDEFERLDTRNVISASDIIHFIMDLEGVEMINTLNIIDKDNVKHQWLQSVEKGKAFEIDTKRTKIRFFKFGKLVHLKEDLTQEIAKIEKKEDSRLRFKKLTFTREEGVYRNLSQFNTIQNDFPQVYGIGELGLQSSETNARKGLAKQLKSYLLYFEQILTNFYAQLANLNKIFSIDTIFNSYYGQPLIDIPGIEALYKPFIIDCIKNNIDINNPKVLKAEWKQNLSKNIQLTERIIREIIEDEETFYDRRHRILDHLLGRMSFNYSDYYYDFESGVDDELKLIRHKTKILKNYVKLSKERSSAQFLLKNKNKNSNKISGFEFRINSFLKLSGSSDKFPFKFYKNIFSINKTADYNKEDKLSLTFKQTTKEQLIKDVFKYASKIKNYIYKDKKIHIVNDTHKSFATVNEKNLKENDLHKYSSKMSTKLGKMSMKSEAIFVIERLLYRPHPEMNYFTFSVLDEAGDTLYINNGYLKFADRSKKVKEVIKLAQERKHYNFKEVFNQYKMTIIDDDKNELLLSHRFFNTTQEVEEAITQQIDYFKKIDKEQISLEDSIRFYTKHYDLYNLVSNPYSFITTVLVPDWPARFQNNAFRSHLLNIIEEEMPSHIYPDIKSVSIEKLLIITDLCNEYQSILRDKKPDFLKLEKISDELFGYFLS